MSSAYWVVISLQWNILKTLKITFKFKAYGDLARHPVTSSSNPSSKTIVNKPSAIVSLSSPDNELVNASSPPLLIRLFFLPRNISLIKRKFTAIFTCESRWNSQQLEVNWLRNLINKCLSDLIRSQRNHTIRNRKNDPITLHSWNETFPNSTQHRRHSIFSFHCRDAKSRGESRWWTLHTMH